jgi:serine/threonine-protein kinase
MTTPVFDDDERPQDFGPYRVVARLGRGGMARVYKAVHADDGTTVALKVLEQPDGDSAEFYKRARREVAALQMCSHRNILKVHAFHIEPGKGGWVAMEFIDGSNLQDMSARGAMEIGTILQIARDIGGALAYCHARELFHRDIKPANIMVEGGTGRAVLLDFGIVKAMNMTQISGFQREVIGTLTYMSPEQFLSKAVDGRTDVYQLGLVLYRLAAGRDPPPVMDLLEKESAGDRAAAAAPIRSQNASVPAALETLIENCIYLSPDRRYASAQDFLGDLDRIARGESVTPRPAPRATAKKPVVVPEGGRRPPAGPSGPLPAAAGAAGPARATGKSPVARDRSEGAAPRRTTARVAVSSVAPRGPASRLSGRRAVAAGVVALAVVALVLGLVAWLWSAR